MFLKSYGVFDVAAGFGTKFYIFLYLEIIISMDFAQNTENSFKKSDFSLKNPDFHSKYRKFVQKY